MGLGDGRLGPLWLFSLGGGEGLQVVERPDGKKAQKNIAEPTLSPDGRWIYYSQDVTEGRVWQYNKDATGQIFVIKRLERKTGDVETYVGGPGARSGLPLLRMGSSSPSCAELPPSRARSSSKTSPPARKPQSTIGSTGTCRRAARIDRTPCCPRAPRPSEATRRRGPLLRSGRPHRPRPQRRIHTPRSCL